MRENRPYEDTRSIHANPPPAATAPGRTFATNPGTTPSEPHGWHVTHIDCPFPLMLKWLLKFAACGLLIQIALGTIFGLCWLLLLALAFMH